jgi:hypothetical protein
MRLGRKPPEKAPTGYVGDHADKIGHVRPMAHDEDERPSADDRGAYHSLFTSALEPVPLPRWFKPGRRRGRRAP